MKKLLLILLLASILIVGGCSSLNFDVDKPFHEMDCEELNERLDNSLSNIDRIQILDVMQLKGCELE